ncbi:hypothetical protein PIB30_053384 [Stylosanthes scabra]|uniref:Uncharacterized protein n=1 Tax=Stylosanthes scabra TaxID=79078 RepID=A0ABU6SJ07_9FABA|nr:hypothetical protein [Stylosanthes scabra]
MKSIIKNLLITDVVSKFYQRVKVSRPKWASDTCAREKNGDYTLSEGAISGARAKKLNESFGNLAALIDEEMHQLLQRKRRLSPLENWVRNLEEEENRENREDKGNSSMSNNV